LSAPTTLALKLVGHIPSHYLGQQAGLVGYMPCQEHIISTGSSAIDSDGPEDLLTLVPEIRTMQHDYQYATWILGGVISRSCAISRENYNKVPHQSMQPPSSGRNLRYYKIDEKRSAPRVGTISILGPTLDVYISQEALVWLSGSRTLAKLTIARLVFPIMILRLSSSRNTHLDN
jgi:hypothetical protein